MKALLEKTRELNKRLQQSKREKDAYINFDEVSKILSTMIECNTYILDEEGKLLGHYFMKEFACSVMEDIIMRDGQVPEAYNHDLVSKGETIANSPNSNRICVFDDKEVCSFGEKLTTIIPIYAGRERQGTLLLAKFDIEFTDEDLILAEYGATIVGIDILRNKEEHNAEEHREKAAVQIAIDTLSFSEMEAIEHIFAELDGEEGLLVASKVADRVGITRSVIVNALRKFESAGVIESKSLGMKGTFIRVLNPYLLEEVKKRGSFSYR